MQLINDYKDFIRKYNKEIFSTIYMILLVHFFWGTTMIDRYLPRCYTWICLAALLLYVYGKLLIEPYKKYKIYLIVIIILFTTSGLVSGYHEMMYTGLLVVAAKDISIDRVLKNYLVVSIPFLLFTILGSQVGIVENLIYPSLYRGDRISYGFLSPTDFCAHVLFIILVLFSICKKENYWKLIVLSILIAIFLYIKCDGRTTVLSLLVFLTGFLICYIIKNWIDKNKHIVLSGVYVCEGIIVLTSFVCGWLYQFESVYIIKLNEILSDRLKYISQTMEMYDVRIWGQYIEEHGNGGSIIAKDNYFFIDNSFVRCAYEYGVIVLILAIVLMFIAQKRMIDGNRYIMSLAFLIVVIASFAEHHFLEIAYNPFTFSVFACISSCEKKL